jgi:hypothetical protein
VDAVERFKAAIAQAAYEEALATGEAFFFAERISHIADSVSASERDTRRALGELEAAGRLVQQQRGVWKAGVKLLLDYERADRKAAYTQNAARRYLLEQARKADDTNKRVVFSESDDTDPFPQPHLFLAAKVLDWQGYVDLDTNNTRHFGIRLAAPAYSLLDDPRRVDATYPVTPTDDTAALPRVAPDALSTVIQDCEQMLEQRGWASAATELHRGDVEYRKGNWINAVREYYAALESGLKYALHQENIDYAEGSALRRLAGQAAEVDLIPLNYQSVFSYPDSIRSPRSHGAGPAGEITEVEVGQAEALLLGNLTRTLLLYLGNRPSVSKVREM